MMKRLSVFLVLVLLLSLLAGCSGSREASASSSSTSGSAEESASVSAPEKSGDFSMPEADIHPMLFQVTGENGQQMYLFGTIHTGDRHIDTALQKLTPFLEGCDALALEADPTAASDMALEILSYYLYEDGSTIDTHMSPELYEKASALVQQMGYPPEILKYYNYSMWMSLVEEAAISTTTQLTAESGMEMKLVPFCKERNIPIREVEGLIFQMELLSSFSDELYALFIQSVVDNLDTYGEGIYELYSAWLKGDYDQIAILEQQSEASSGEDVTEEQKALIEDYYDKLLIQRNLGMRNKALEWMKAGDKVFFAVGAFHLVGQDGLVELLRAAGYTVEQLSY